MTIIAKSGDTVTFDWTFRRPTGDAPTITGTPEYRVMQGNTTVKALSTMTAVTGTRYTATWATTAGSSGEYVVIATGTFDSLSGEELIARVDISQEMTNLSALTTAKAGFIDVAISSRSTTITGSSNLQFLTSGRTDNLDFLDISVASRAATTAANLQALTTARIGRLDAAITSRSTTISNSSGIFGALTTGRISNLDNLDATVSSRSVTTTITGSSVITAFTTNRIANLDNLDATVSSRSVSTTISGSSNISALTTGRIDNLDFLDISVASRAATTAANLQALTTARVERLDATVSSRLATTNAKIVALTTSRVANLDNLDATVSSRSVTTTISGSSNISSLTTGRIENLDNLDATISSRSTSTNFAAGLVWSENTTASNTSGTAGRYLSDLKKRHLNTVTASSATLTVYQDGSTSSAAWTQTLSSGGDIITQGAATT